MSQHEVIQAVDENPPLFHAKPAGQQQLCWTNNYDLAALDSRRITFSELTPEEILEGEI